MKISNESKIKAMLCEANARAKVRTCEYSDLVCALGELDNRLAIFTKSAREGLIVDVDVNAQVFPSSYRYTPQSTIATCEFQKGQWRMLEARRTTCQRKTYKVKGNLVNLMDSFTRHFDTFLNK